MQIALGDELCRLAADIVQARADRKQARADQAGEVRQLRHEMGLQRASNFKQYRKQSSLAESQRRKASTSTLSALGVQRAENGEQYRKQSSLAESQRRKASTSTLSALGVQRAKMRHDLDAQFASHGADLARWSTEFHSQARSSGEARRQHRADLSQQMQNNFSRARAAWGGNGAPSAPKSSTKSKPAPKPPAKSSMETMESKAGAPEPTKDPPDSSLGLEERVLACIGRHRDGVRLALVEEELDVPRIRLGQICKILVNQDLLIKEGKLYYSAH